MRYANVFIYDEQHGENMMSGGARKRTVTGAAQSATISAILNAAEEVFGTHGFDGGSMREISQLAGIAQSLLHYHYSNKVALYEAVFERRASIIHDVRLKHLNEIIDKQPRLEDILDILFLPLDQLLGEKRGNLKFYVQLLAGVTISADERSANIVKRFYDPSAEHFVAALKIAEPLLSHESAVWAYLFSIGARMQAHSPSDRPRRLGASSDQGRPYGLLVKFVAEGIRGISRQV
jgi:AcrR family transcriptional regulator